MNFRKYARRFIYGRNPGFDFDELIREAQVYPRYKRQAFKFSANEFVVTDFLSVAWQLREIFYEEQLKFASDTVSPLILDCGANAGVSVLYFKKLFPRARILAFEPDPALMNVLNENLRLNNVSGVEVFEKAVWIHNDGIRFGSDGADGGSVYLDSNTVFVSSVRLKEVLQTFETIDFLKMDIEGAETDVLPDCSHELSRVRNLFVEYHSWTNQRQKLDELLHVLTEAGFRYVIRSLGADNFNPYLGKVEKGMDNQLNIYATRIIK